MKILIEESVVRKALATLEGSHPSFGIHTEMWSKSVKALRSALDAAEKVEPVAWMMETTHKTTGEKCIWISTDRKGWTGMESVTYGEQVPLYTHPAPEAKP